IFTVIPMVNRKISPDLKDCAISLWEKGWEVMDVCEAFNVSKSSLYRWQKLFDELGTMARPPSPLHGRPRLLVHAIMNEVEHLFSTDPDLYLDEVIFWLAINHDIVISKSALQRNLEDAGLT
ncbi:hypothetical protein BDN72DRAFT_782425, partial [Pluteus cervinus]